MKNNAFTLVELIVVVTILAILATIGFVSYSGYLTGVRDTNRIASLTSISDGLELYRTKNDLPNPDDGINIQVDGTTIANQGYVGINVLQTIEYSKAGKDPKDDTYYSYYLTDDKKHYQLMAFLEETENLESYSIVGKTNAAVNYSNRYPKVYGKKLGILTDTNNTPVQEIINSSLNFSGGTTTEYISRFTDIQAETLSGSLGIQLASITENGGLYSDCKTILQKNKSLEGKDGTYIVADVGGIQQTYCDMTTNGGGWTMFSYNAEGLPAGIPTSGGANYGTLDQSGTATMNILQKKFAGIMGYHFDTKDYIIFDNIDTRGLISELKDVAGESSNSYSAQTNIGTANHSGKIGNYIFSKKTPNTIFEVHRSDWNPLNNTNWVINAGPKIPGASADLPLSISVHGHRLLNESAVTVTTTGGRALFFR